MVTGAFGLLIVKSDSGSIPISLEIYGVVASSSTENDHKNINENGAGHMHLSFFYM